MSRALILFRSGLYVRQAAFVAGLKRVGYSIVDRLTDPKPGDVLVIWNRMGEGHSRAREFEAAKAHVLVVENGYLGKDWRDDCWYAISRNHHNGAGTWSIGGPGRWDALGVELAPWRPPGGECVILAQRGIGEPGLRCPDEWINHAVRITKGRIRRHPGTSKDGVSLEHDLRNASCVVTWSSGAAIKALTMGIPVFYGLPKWIGAPASRPLTDFAKGPLRDDGRRLLMFHWLAWAQWRLREIEDGAAFRYLLDSLGGREAKE